MILAIIIILVSVNLAFGTPSVKTIFVENQGQWNNDILFRSIDGRISIRANSIEIGGIKIKFANSRTPKVRGRNPGKGSINFFVGKDASRWKRSVPYYDEVVFENIGNGIDLIVKGMRESNVSLQWVVHPGADPGDIELKIEGAPVEISDGGLKIGEVSLGNVKAFQGTQIVDVDYIVKGNSISFRVGNYDRTSDLIIDPSVVIGGKWTATYESHIALYGSDLYVALTDYVDTLRTGGAIEGVIKDFSAVVLRIDKDDFSVLSGIVFGGFDVEHGSAIDVSSSGVYVAGITNSPDFPIVSGSFDEDFNGDRDVYIVRLDLDLSTILAGTYLGGSETDYLGDLEVGTNSVYIVGYTNSPDFPTVPGSYGSDLVEGNRVFVTKMSLDLSTLDATAFLGGSSADYGYSMKLSSDGVYVVGETYSGDFPVTSGPYGTDGVIGGAGFVSKLSLDLTTLIASTYFGGRMREEAHGVDIYEGNVYVAGYTGSAEFPTTPGAYDRNGVAGFSKGFILKFDSEFNTLLAGTLIGGSGPDELRDIEVTSDGVFVAGMSLSRNYPTTAGSFDTDYNGGFGDGIISRLSLDLSSLISSTYIGGSSSDAIYSIEAGSDGIYVSGITGSSDFPANTYDTTWSKMGSGFVAKFDFNLSTQVSSFLDSAYTKGSYDLFGAWALYEGAFYILGSTTGLISSGEHDTLGLLGMDIILLKVDASNLEILGGMHLGGSGWDYGYGIAVSEDGVYITGKAGAFDFPATAGSYDDSYNGYYDVFVSKISFDLTSLLASTFLGGSSSDIGMDIDLTSDGVYVLGATQSDNFPTTAGAYDGDYNGGIQDVFVSKLSLDLSDLLGSTFVGGSQDEYPASIEISGDGVYIAGYTGSNDFPITPGSFDDTKDGLYDAFVSKFDLDLGSMVASTFIGGSYTDAISDMVLTTDGIYITGYTYSSDFPATAGSYTGNGDIFISKLNSDLSSQLASMLIGGTNEDGGSGITVYGSDVYVSGYTFSSDFPITSGAYDESYNGNGDAVIIKLNSGLDALLGSTYLGGANFDEGKSVIVTPDWVYVGGNTYSLDFPITKNLNYSLGSGDIFITGLTFDLTPVNANEETEYRIVPLGNGILINLPHASYVGYEVYSPSGKLVDRISSGLYPAGALELNFNKYPAGVYMIRIRIDSVVKDIKVVVGR